MEPLPIPRHRHWQPASTGYGDVGDIRQVIVPEVGHVIVLRNDRRPLRVVETCDVPVDLWPAGYADRVAGYKPEYQHGYRPRMVIVRPAANERAKPEHLQFLPAVHRRGESWHLLPEPWAVCSSCGGLWPCPCCDANHEAAVANAELERIEGILPGCCWACNEPIIESNRSITFDGPNLILPGGPPVAFHTAKSRKAKGPHGPTCRAQAIAYEEKWIASAPDEARPVRLKCPGHLFRHLDGYDCSTGQECPGSGANHPGESYCTTAVGALLAGTNQVVDRRPTRTCEAKGCRGICAEIAATDDETGAVA